MNPDICVWTGQVTINKDIYWVRFDTSKPIYVTLGELGNKFRDCPQENWSGGLIKFLFLKVKKHNNIWSFYFQYLIFKAFLFSLIKVKFLKENQFPKMTRKTFAFKDFNFLKLLKKKSWISNFNEIYFNLEAFSTILWKNCWKYLQFMIMKILSFLKTKTWMFNSYLRERREPDMPSMEDDLSLKLCLQ